MKQESGKREVSCNSLHKASKVIYRENYPK